MAAFVHDAVMLDLHRVITTFIENVPSRPTDAADASSDTQVYQGVWDWPKNRRLPRPLALELRVTGPSASLRMNFANFDGKPCTDGHVAVLSGEGLTRRWMVRCSKSGKLVQRLYLSPDAEKFQSRHAAGLIYQSQRRNELERLEAQGHKLMRQLGGTGWEGGPRPKGMTNIKYRQLSEELQETYGQWLNAALERSFSESDEEIDGAVKPRSKRKAEPKTKGAKAGGSYEVTKDGIRKRAT